MDPIYFNNQIKIVVSDVDETVADVYKPAEPEMINELTNLLNEGVVLFFVTGGSLKRIQNRIVEKIDPKLKAKIVISHCSGAEVWGFTSDGKTEIKPYYSIYEETFTAEQKTKWREIVQELLTEFHLTPHDAIPVNDFREQTKSNPTDIMLEDRGPQITLEFVNAYDLSPEQRKKFEFEIPETHGSYDLRIPVLEKAEQLFTENNLPISPRLGGVFALDFAVKGVSKTTSVRYVFDNPEILQKLGLPEDIERHPEMIEIWGDKFSVIRGGTDRHMCEALPKEVRAIDFRPEDPKEFLEGYNIVLWNGVDHLHEGLLEYLKKRHN
jgi:hydroxymethylpyrimidine pyrophosphatase-like HAD family hydrolase